METQTNVQGEPAQKTSIPLTLETRELLKGFGKKGETYDSLIRRLIEASKMKV
jgi:hypothetical protein